MDVKLGQRIADMLNSFNGSSNVVCKPCAVSTGRIGYPISKYYIDTPSVERHIIKAQLRWASHLARMEDHRIPKAFLFGKLENGERSVGIPRPRHEDILKNNLKE